MDEERAPRKLINWAALKENSDRMRETRFSGEVDLAKFVTYRLSGQERRCYSIVLLFSVALFTLSKGQHQKYLGTLS